MRGMCSGSSAAPSRRANPPCRQRGRRCREQSRHQLRISMGQMDVSPFVHASVSRCEGLRQAGLWYESWLYCSVHAHHTQALFLQRTKDLFSMGQQLGCKSTVTGGARCAEVTLPSRFGQRANFDLAVEENQGCRLREARACHKRPQALIVRIGGMCIISVHAHHSSEAYSASANMASSVTGSTST